MNRPIKKSAMAAGVLLAIAAFATVSAEGAVKHRALLTNSNFGRTQNQILLFDVLPTSWEYVRTVVHPMDGHCRIPGGAAYVNGVVYVTDWLGKDDRNASNRSAARILKYDIEGNYLGVLVDEIIDPAGLKVNWAEAIVASHDGNYLYVNQPGNGNSNKCYVYRYNISNGVCSAVLGPYTALQSPVCETSDGGTLIVADVTNNGSDNVFVYSVAGDTYTLGKSYCKANACSAYLDESTDRLYLSGVNSGIDVYDYGSGSTEPLSAGSSGHYPQIKKIGGELYASYMAGCRMLRMYHSAGSDGLSSSQIMPNTGLKIYTGIDRAFIFTDYSYEDSGAVEIAHYKFDEDPNSAVFTNSISTRWPIRSYRTQSGATGVSGGAVYFGEANSYAVIEGSRGMVGGNWGLFMWFGCNNRVDTTVNLFSNSMKEVNVGRFSLLMDCGRLVLRNTLLGAKATTVAGDVLRDGKYHHIGVVKNGKDISLYIDGVKKATVSDWCLGLDDTMDFVIGARVDGHERFVLTNSYYDDLRIFDGAPTDADVKAMYDDYKDVAASLAVPSRPSLPSHDSSVAETYGSVVSHSFTHQTPRTPPAVVVQSNGVCWVAFGSRTIPSSKDSKGSACVSVNHGVSWSNATDNVYAYCASLFECKEDGVVYALGRTAYDLGVTGYSVSYNTPEYECDGRIGFSSFTFEEGKKYRTGFYTNDVNQLAYRSATLEIDRFTPQEICPGAGAVIGTRFYLPYCANDRIGLVSGTVTAGTGITDFRGEVASVVSKAAKPFAGPVVQNTDGRVAVMVPAGLSGSGVATVDIASRNAIGDTIEIVDEGIELPGSDRPFAIKFDPVRRQYWAATTPNGTSLCLYASRDLKEWGLAKTVFTVSSAETTRVSNPAFDISGHDIALAFNLACPDGGPALRSLDDPNYVMVRTVSSFRRYSPFNGGFVMTFR